MRRHRVSNVAITTVLVLTCILVFTMLPVLAWQKYPLPTMGGTGTIVINGPSDNETVVYDQATGTWVNAALSAVARDSLSCTAPGLTYDHATGITSLTPGYGIPTTGSQTNWNTAYSHAGLTNNPHGVTKSQVGIGNVENTALSTWGGSTNLTTTGTLPTLTVGTGNTAYTKVGTVDAYGRPQIWNYAWNATNSVGSILRLGSLQPDGDATGNVSSEGIVVYGTQDGVSTNMKSMGLGDAYNYYGYARIKSNRIGLYSTDSRIGFDNYYFRVDPTSLYLRKDDGNKSFDIARATGIITAATWQGNAIGDSYISSAANWNTGYSHSSATGNPHSTALGNLTNVNISSPANGQVLKYDNGTSKWINAAESGGGSSTLTALTDVNLTSPTDGQVLKYDNASSKWINATGTGSYTDADARLALSNTATGLTYNTATGQTSLTAGYVIPTTTQETNWGSAYTHSGLTTGNPHSVTKSDVGLGSVENTAMSTWGGSSNISTVGTIGSGTWNGSAIPIANGGTGQITASAAFNALRPTTAKGDIVSDNGMATVVLAVGSNGQVLKADSSTPSGLTWGTDGIATLSQSNVDNFTMTLSPDNVTLSVASWIPDNISITAIRLLATASLSNPYNMEDGIVDSLKDQTGTGTCAICSGQNYDGSGKYYTSGALSSVAVYDYTHFNPSDYRYLGDGASNTKLSECFTTTQTVRFTSASFALMRTGSPNGNFTVNLWPKQSGTTVGTNAYPDTSGSPLATVSSAAGGLGTSFTGLTEYSFTTPYDGAAGDYCVDIEYSGGNGSNYIRVADNLASTYSGGNKAQYFSSWGAEAVDFLFEVKGYVTSSSAYVTSIATTAASQPAQARLVFLSQDVTGGSTLNTDILGYVSRDSGTTWDQVTLADEGAYAAGQKIYGGTVTLTSTGTAMKWKWATANTKEVRLLGVALTWK
ncbi:MAG: hypothetical protein HQL61_09135 [Magnetococcales bacterium]|nr:hypothetical protein [Nitrospirota bacterium]